MLSLKDGEVPIAIARGGKANGTQIYANIDTIEDTGFEGTDRVKIIGGKFEQIPNDRDRVMYISGASGSGKSHYISIYVKNQLKMFPDTRCLLISKITDDPAFKDIPFKVVPITDNLIKEPLEYEEADEDSLFVFDDIDTISNEKLRKSVYNFLNQLVELGRHKRIKVLITCHLLIGNDRKQSRTMINESNTITIFPDGLAPRQAKYALTGHANLDGEQVDKILAMKSRWITIFKRSPQLILTETEVRLLKNL